MPILFTKEHREIVGHVDGEPFRVLFDSDGYSNDVDDSVARQLVANKSATIVPEVGENLDFAKANPAQLKRWAKDHNIDVGDATKKAELLAIIEEAQKEKANDGEPTTPPQSGNNGDTPPVV